MTTILQLITAFATTFLLSCNSHSSNTTIIQGRDTTTKNDKALVDTPRSFVRNYGANETNRLFVFVGEKISVDALPHEQHSMDNGFKAKYLIIERVFGHFPQDTIEFVAYDHYGTPSFSNFKNVMLYVSADSGMYYHQKYMYNNVYKTKDGRWAGIYAGEDYEHEYNNRTNIKPVKIDFAEKVIYPTKMIDEEGRQLTFSYPKQFFKTVGDSAIAVYGNYIDDLFKLKRDGYLTAREIFKNGKLVQ